MKKNGRLIIAVSIFITFFILFIIFFLEMNRSSLAIKKLELKKYEKQHFGGKVINKTSTPIKIFDNGNIRSVPGNKSSRDIGVFDADLILIEKPLVFENKEYSNGIIKFCDLATVKVYKKEDSTIVKPSLIYNLCKIKENVGWFPSVKEVSN